MFFGDPSKRCPGRFLEPQAPQKYGFRMGRPSKIGVRAQCFEDPNSCPKGSEDVPSEPLERLPKRSQNQLPRMDGAEAAPDTPWMPQQASQRPRQAPQKGCPGRLGGGVCTFGPSGRWKTVPVYIYRRTNHISQTIHSIRALPLSIPGPGSVELRRLSQAIFGPRFGPRF